MKLGAQFYTLRDFAKDTDSLAESLKKVADIGYRTVQISGTCAYEPQWLKEQLDKNGLECVLTHVPLGRITDDTDQLAADHKVFGCRHIGIGMGPGAMASEDDLQATIDIAHKAGGRLHELGHLLMYHNHHHEFNHSPDGRTHLQVLADSTTPEEIGFTLDTYWVQYGGGNPAEWVEKLSGRVPCVHFKDLSVVGSEVRMAPVGRGNLNFEHILTACEKAGTEYILVEQDNCYGEDPFDCLRESYKYLTSLGLQ